MSDWSLSDDRYFSPEPSHRAMARTLYDYVKDLPLLCPHGHVPPELLADPDARLGTPAELFIIPDHYVTRMLYSQGIRLEDLGIPTKDGTPVETDHRKIWQRFADHFYLFRGTPTGLWIKDGLASIFNITEKLDGDSAQKIYDQLEDRLAQEQFSPRALFRRFDIETLCTTDHATDALEHHQSLVAEGWEHTIRPTFRPDRVVRIDTPGWIDAVDQLGDLTKMDIDGYPSFIRALEIRREQFKALGATATDHGAYTAATERLTDREAQSLFDQALMGSASADDADRFEAHMLHEMARMSQDDGLVMQLHIGSFRNHNEDVFRRFGPDRGGDIPVHTEWTRALHPLLNAFGNNPDFHLIVFTLDESTYSRELAPLAGHWPSVYLGPPWWFFDSPAGMRRYFDAVTETAGIYNTAGFNDDTRAFASIPVRHDMWRRVSCNWLAGLVVQGIVGESDAASMARALAYDLAKKAYKL